MMKTKMMKMLFLMALLPAQSSLYAQTTLYSEDFQSGATLQTLGYTLYNDGNTPCTSTKQEPRDSPFLAEAFGVTGSSFYNK